MRSGALTSARSVLLAGPVVLAFFSGGYFDEPRVWAGLAAWALVAVAAVASTRPLPRAGGPRVALLGLTMLAAWTLASLTWAPLAGTAYHDGQRVVLYAGALVAATALLRGRAPLRAVEPAVAAGALVVVVYGMSERLAPWLVALHHSLSASGRLEQPLTYWNAMGEVAALGLVLCARIAGTPSRPDRVRTAAAAASAPLGLGLYLTFSRGALFACLVGVITLVVAAPRWAQLRAVGVTLASGVLSALAATPFAGVASLSGSHSTRVLQGTVTLILLVVIASAAALIQRAAVRRERAGEWGAGGLRLPRRAPVIALLVVSGAFAGFLAVGAKEKTTRPLSAGATRFGTLQTNRYAYWRVAERAFGAEPLRGVGAGGWAVYWLRYRPFSEGAQDAHSLYIQTAAELGLVGLALLGTFLGGVAWAARGAAQLAPELAVGPLAGCVVWAAHAAVDWDWEMPAATLPAIVLAGALLAMADGLGGIGRRAAGASARADPPVLEAVPRHGTAGGAPTATDRLDRLARVAHGGVAYGSLMRPRIWLTLPTLNEAGNLERIVRAALEQLELVAPGDHRLLVVDDASPDGTGELAERLAEELPAVEVLHRRGRRGLGRAYLAGFEHALAGGAELVIVMDADFSHDPGHIPALIAAAAENDLVLGSRYIAGGRILDWPRLRRLLSRGGSVYARSILGVQVRDLTAGFRCIRREVLEAVELPTLRSQGYVFNIELTYRALLARFRVKEVPIIFRDRAVGHSKISLSIAVEALFIVPSLRFPALARAHPARGAALVGSANSRHADTSSADWSVTQVGTSAAEDIAESPIV